MTIHFDSHGIVVHHGDCLTVLAGLPDASIDAVVTDPPYALGFMGVKWDTYANETNRAKSTRHSFDHVGGNHNPTDAADSVRTRRVEGHRFQAWCQLWATECLRVLKPGGHLLAFGGTRTYHRLACAIEDAGFEIRDSIGYGSSMLAWCYGSGFPKSLNVSQDERFCQCLPDVRGAAIEEAAESAAEVLLADLRRSGKADVADVKDLHGLPVSIYPRYAVSGGAEPDVLAGVRGQCDESGEPREAGRERPAGNSAVRDVRGECQKVTEPSNAQRGDLLLSGVRGSCEDSDAPGTRLRRNGQAGGPEVRPGEPGVEGGSDVQAVEGQLHRSQVCEMPGSVGSDGADRRIRDGAQANDGTVGRPDVAADGVREPHQPQPEGQPQGEPGAVSDERRPQTGRGWPICGWCHKPAVPRGLGTALKPSWEPIVVARKPLTGTVASTVLAHGTGALNIDATRVGGEPRTTHADGNHRTKPHTDIYGKGFGVHGAEPPPAGRWPPNVVLDDDTAHQLDQQTGELTSGKQLPTHRRHNQRMGASGIYGASAAPENDALTETYGDTGGASRFFPVFRYQAKAGSAERPRDTREEVRPESGGHVAHPT